MKLNYKKMGSGRPLIILHGLFGMLDNWQSIGRELAKDHTVWLVDQRNHGRSPHADVHHYDALAEDVAELIRDHNINQPVVVGHSMGGKTALRLAQLHPEMLSGIVVVDMGLKAYPILHDTIIAALKSVPVDSVASRSEAEEYLKQHIEEFGVRQFLLKNLHRKSTGGFEWKMNLSSLEEQMPKIVAALPDDPIAVPAQFIRGTRSNYVLDSDIPAIRAKIPDLDMRSLDAGHWVHAEQPNAVIDAIRDFTE